MYNGRKVLIIQKLWNMAPLRMHGTVWKMYMATILNQKTPPSLRGSCNNQYNNRHLLKAGFDYRMFDIDRSGHDVWYGRTLVLLKIIQDYNTLVLVMQSQLKLQPMYRIRWNLVT
ncbi:MAG: hypothetical protein CM1200mP10_07830 [Candidatus Neomarinimicrobiota bacterium]|nr:MAG: hypothetical protein CM1200mP10_07830 [Candidatus Neomarinimicrobiota bacterium]